MTSIKPRTERVVIYQGDDIARLRDLDEAAIKAEADLSAAKRAAKKDGAQDLVDVQQRRDEAVAERDRFAAEAEGRGVVVMLKQLGRKDWRRLRNAHPPREGNSEDEALDCNVDSMPDEAIPLSIDHDQSTIEGDLDEFLDSLSTHDYYMRLFNTVLRLNVGGAGVNPTLRLGSTPSLASSATSN